VLIVGLTYFFSGIGTSSRAENALTAAAISLDNGNLDTAREQLARVDRGDLEGDLLRRYDELSGQLEAREQFTGDSEVRSAATRWIDEELRALVDKQFKTLPPEPAKVRLLLDRIAQWRELFPQHNSEAWRLDNNLVADLAWIAEHEQKWADLANRSDRYTLADAEFRAYYFLDKAPKRYHEVMPVVTAALNSSTDEMERELLTSLRDRLLSEQRTYAAEQLAKARQFYEEGNDVQSSRILVTDIRTLTEPDLIDTAADMLLRFERARELLKGYRTRPVDYEALMRVPKVAAFMATLTAEETAPGS
jgi:hypothetical protein